MDTTIYDALNNSFVHAYEGAKGFLQLGAFNAAARAIGMIGATIYIFSRIWGPIAMGEPINFFPLMRPFVLLIAIIFSNPLCNSLELIFKDIDRISTLDYHMSTSRAKIDQAIVLREKEYLKYVQLREQMQTDRYLDAFKNEDGSLNVGSTIDPVGTLGGVFVQNMTDDAIDGMQEAFVKMMVYIFDGAGLIGYFLITLFSLFLTNILTFVAPLAFAFAIFDGFANNAAEWFAKYINAKLMVLICKAYTIFTYYLEQPFIANSLEWATGRTALYIIVVFVSVIGYFFVPTMANMALSVGGFGPSASIAGQRTIAMKNLVTSTAMGAGRLITAPFKAMGKLI